MAEHTANELAALRQGFASSGLPAAYKQPIAAQASLRSEDFASKSPELWRIVAEFWPI